MSPTIRRTIPKTLLIALAALVVAPAAWAAHPSHHQMKKVKRLAHEVYEGAHYLHEKSARYATHDWRDEKARYALHELSKRAHDFYRASDRYYGDPYRTEDAFRDLIHAYYFASDRFRYLYAYDHYRRDFECLRDLMDDLVYYYGGYDAYERHRYERHGRYDRPHKKPYYGPRSKTGKILYYLHHYLEHDGR